MKDPETVRRIEELARAETALALARAALDAATRHIGMVVPSDHPISKSLAESRLSFAKTDTLTTELLKRFSR